MLLNCDNALQAYVQLHDLLTFSQRLRLIAIAAYEFEMRKLACK